ncbi:DUF4142 domain-containing protein [Roseivirga sp. BDSF3-8]|uniref:DUF4142 domain-containing protein n=1 Tax=Roseivirga sp. BDSF3-8 TaxID=3241598 RepID=UPI0035320B6F
MIRNTTHILIAALGLFIMGCSVLGGGRSYDDAMDKNQNRFSDNRELLDDAEFLVEMQSFGLMLKAAGDTASNRAYARKVAEFGKEISEKMEFYLKDLDKVADDKDIVLPEEMSSAHRNELEDLLDTDEDNFDEAFLTTIESQLQKKRRQAERIATEGYDDDVRAWTARQLKMMKDYENKADSMEDELLTN